MILRRRTVEVLAGEDLPAGLPAAVERVLVLGGLPCSTIATGSAQPPVMAVGSDRAASLRRLRARLLAPPRAPRGRGARLRRSPA